MRRRLAVGAVTGPRAAGRRAAVTFTAIVFIDAFTGFAAVAFTGFAAVALTRFTTVGLTRFTATALTEVAAFALTGFTGLRTDLDGAGTRSVASSPIAVAFSEAAAVFDSDACRGKGAFLEEPASPLLALVPALVPLLAVVTLVALEALPAVIAVPAVVALPALFTLPVMAPFLAAGVPLAMPTLFAFLMFAGFVAAPVLLTFAAFAAVLSEAVLPPLTALWTVPAFVAVLEAVFRLVTACTGAFFETGFFAALEEAANTSSAGLRAATDGAT